MKKINSKLFSKALSNEAKSRVKGGRPKLVKEEIWTDGLNTYKDTYWSDGTQVCGHYEGCDCK